jgi:hypothetical protein
MSDTCTRVSCIKTQRSVQFWLILTQAPSLSSCQLDTSHCVMTPNSYIRFHGFNYWQTYGYLEPDYKCYINRGTQFVQYLQSPVHLELMWYITCFVSSHLGCYATWTGKHRRSVGTTFLHLRDQKTFPVKSVSIYRHAVTSQTTWIFITTCVRTSTLANHNVLILSINKQQVRT